MLSKRVLLRLVEEGHVRGWDDPRMPTISGLRRRGFPAEGIRDFAADVGVAQADSVHRDRAAGARGARRPQSDGGAPVRRPRSPQGGDHGLAGGPVETLEVVNNPEDPAAGTRQVAFGRELWIERDDFMEDPAPKFFRLAPGREVRLRNAYFVTCREVVQGRRRAGRGAALHLRPGDARRRRARWSATQGDPPLGLGRPRGARRGPPLRPPLRRPDPGADGDLFEDLDPASETVVPGAMLEPSLAETPPGETVQFERLGYFTPDLDSRPGALVFNRTLTLKDTWAKVQARTGSRPVRVTA